MDIVRSLIGKQIRINEAFVDYGVKGPYAQQLGISDDHVKEFTAKVVILLNHVNLLWEVHQGREVLGADRVESYEEWARNIVGPWIEADEDLKNTWRLLRGT
jgi:hypothetical protein